MGGSVRFFVWLKRVVSVIISSTTRPETEAGPRPIKAGLGVQESGVSGDDEGSKTHRFSYRNGGDWQCPIVPPSVILWVLTMKTSVRIENTWSKTSDQKSSMDVYHHHPSNIVSCPHEYHCIMK